MRLIAFISGRPKPLPRTTVKSKFLFGKTVEQWAEIDKSNAEKAQLGLLNKLGNPYKATRYSYRLDRLQKTNAYRDNIKETVIKAVGKNIPAQNLFFFFLFNAPKSWSKKKQKAHHWQVFDKRPDTSNLVKLAEDALYEEDNLVSAVAYYKMYVPCDIPEGILILHDQEIHQFVIDTAINDYILNLK